MTKSGNYRNQPRVHNQKSSCSVPNGMENNGMLHELNNPDTNIFLTSTWELYEVFNNEIDADYRDFYYLINIII